MFSEERDDWSPGSQAAKALARAVVLVEGISDGVAVERLAQRHGRNLDAEGVSIVPIGGAQSIGRFLDRLGPHGFHVKLAGLCDAGEEAHFRRALTRGSAPASPVPAWRHSVSTSAPRTWKTS